MRVTAPRISRVADGIVRVDLEVGDFPLWYEVPDSLALTGGGEFMVAAGLLPAMARGESLELPEGWGIDPVFRANVAKVQHVMLGWQQKLGLRLSRVEVVAAERPVAAAANPGVMSFFSGGVDGSYTALMNRERIGTLVLLRGIDMQLDNHELWEQARAAAARLAGHWNIPLVTVSTNIRFLGYHFGFKWSKQFQGAGLASVAHLVQHAETLIAASHAIDELALGGSHPLLDPLWSSGSVALVHDGAVPRTDKLKALAEEPVVLEVLRVCWHDSGFNCCRCEKCVRTMLTLRLLRKPAPTFPQPLDLGLLDLLRTDRGGRRDYLDELDRLERECGDPEVRARLDRVLRSELLRQGLKSIDAAFGGPIARLRSGRR